LSSFVHRPVLRLVATVGAACASLAIPVLWPGFEAWPAGSRTLTPADAAGQIVVLEFDHPLRIDFPATFSAPGEPGDPLTAEVTVLSPEPATFAGLPVRIDRARSRLEVSLTGLAGGAGSRLRIVFQDPSGGTWLSSTEHDSYPSGSRVVRDRAGEGDLSLRVYYRRTVLDLLRLGLDVALGSWRLLLAAGVGIGGAGLLAGGALRRIEGLDLAARLSGAIGGGLLFPTLLGWTAGVLRLRITAGAVLLAALATASLGFLLWLRPGAPRARPDSSAAAFVVGLLALGALRLAYASPLSLPPHIDAVEHYAIVADLLAPDRPPLAGNAVALLTTQYYHFGFHGLAAWLLSLAGGETPLALIVLGQLLQTAAIGALYFPVYAAVRNQPAALAAVALAAVGWTMPAHASDWSRYPAMLGLALLPSAAALAILAWQQQGRRRLLLLAVAGIAAVGATLAHTRMLFVIGVLLLSLEAARRLRALPAPGGLTVRKALPIALAVSIVLVAVGLSSPAQRDAAWQSLVRTVEPPGGLSTLLVLCLAPFALRRHPTAALAVLLWAGSILLLVFLPPNASYPFPILDVPLVRMVLFLPLSALGGLGVSGLASALRSPALRPPLARGLRLGLAGLGAIYLIWVLGRQSFAPSDCCLIGGADDVAIAREASRRLTPGERILIAAQAPVNYSLAPVDGGAWLWPLSGLRTVPWPATAELASVAEHRELCVVGITHIYAGGALQSYSREELDLAPTLYAPILVYPNAALYAVIGCGHGGF